MDFSLLGRNQGEEEVNERHPTKNSGLDVGKTAVRLPTGGIWEASGSDSGRVFLARRC